MNAPSLPVVIGGGEEGGCSAGFAWLGFLKLGLCPCHLPSNKVEIWGFK